MHEARVYTRVPMVYIAHVMIYMKIYPNRGKSRDVATFNVTRELVSPWLELSNKIGCRPVVSSPPDIFLPKLRDDVLLVAALQGQYVFLACVLPIHAAHVLSAWDMDANFILFAESCAAS